MNIQLLIKNFVVNLGSQEVKGTGSQGDVLFGTLRGTFCLTSLTGRFA